MEFLREEASPLAAVAARAGVLAEQDDSKPAVRWRFKPMKIQNEEVKQKLVQRLHRIEGQVRGVENMLDEERDCHEILQQLAAIHSAVEGASRVFFQEYATICMAEMEAEQRSVPGADLNSRRAQIIQDMIKLFNKTP